MHPQHFQDGDNELIFFFIGNKKMNERDLRRINGGSNNLKSLSCNEKQNNDLRQINSPIEPEKLILKTVSINLSIYNYIWFSLSLLH